MAEQLESGGAGEADQGDRLHQRLGGRFGDLGGRRYQEGALGGGVQEPGELGAAEGDVVDDDHGAHRAEQLAQFVLGGAAARGVVGGVEEVVEEFAGVAAEAAESDDAVGGEVGAVVGDDIEEPAAAGAGRADQAGGAAAGEQPHDLLALLLALEQRQRRQAGARFGGMDGGAGRGPLGLGALLRGDLGGSPRRPLGRAELDLAAVDGVDGQQEVVDEDLGGAAHRGRVLAEVGCQRVAGRTRARRAAAPPVAALVRPPAVRVHGPKPPKRRVPSPSRPCRTPRARFRSGPP